jgi:tetratricopeptide (TPR) repeat protein
MSFWIRAPLRMTKSCQHSVLGYSVLGYSGALLLLQGVLIIGSWQTGAMGQSSAQAEIAFTSQHENQTDQNQKYPGEETRNALLGAVNRFTDAISADPHRAANYVGLADANIMLWCFGFVPRDDVLVQMKTAAAKAIELDGQFAAAHTALGIARLAEWDWAGAEDEFQLAIRLEPDRAQSHHWHALYLAAMGRHREALRESEQAVKLDPSPGTQTGLGAILYFSGDWTRMIDQMRATTQQNPGFAPGYDWLGMAYVQEKRFDESIATYEKAVRLSGGLAEILAGLGHAYALAGQRMEARKVLEQLQKLDRRWYVPPVQIAYVHVGLGEYDDAFQLLERAYQERSWELVFLQVEPWFDCLRSDPRYIELVKKINFPR